VVQIPILSGIFTDVSPDFRSAYPVNFFAVPKGTGISDGYLRPAAGVVANGSGPGIDRGGIVWRDVPYRVMGTSLVSIAANGTVTTLGDVGSGGQCTFDYSFDRLAIASGGRLYYWDGTTLTQVTDPDLGTVLDVVWVDGYFMTTDGEFLVVTELTDPTQVNPLKYGSSEIDPDPVVALVKIRNEIYAVNRNTIEVFDNVGGELFPFQRVAGAQIQKGGIGTNACCVFMEALAFLGSARNEAPGIYVGSNGNAAKISTQEIDELLLNYTEAQLANVLLEARNDRAHQFLYVHLPDRCLVYDAGASQALQQPVWTVLTTAIVGFAEYRARNLLWAYNQWLVADTQSNAIGYLDRSLSSHWGERVRWELSTGIVYNNGQGAIMSSLELVALTGSISSDVGGTDTIFDFINGNYITNSPQAMAGGVAFGTTPTISTSYTVDGITWSQPRSISVGGLGQRSKRLVWFRQGWMRNWRIQRFQGNSDAHITIARLEAAIEPLAY
jgi:hypothetical protein